MIKKLPTQLAYKVILVTMLLLTTFLSFGKTSTSLFSKKINTVISSIEAAKMMNSISLNYISCNVKQLDETTKIENPIAALLFDEFLFSEFSTSTTGFISTSNIADTFW